MQDRNFDDIAEKFSRNIYGTTKGQLRQAILWQDLDRVLEEIGGRKLRVLDAGGGEGQTAIKMAERGHQVTLCDLSGEMIARARQAAEAKGVSKDMHFIQCPAQDVASHLESPVDLILFHAVLEWVADPVGVLETLWSVLRPGGVLSLMFYNANGLLMHNMVAGNFDYVQAGMPKRKKRTLSPDYPRDPRRCTSGWRRLAGRLPVKPACVCFMIICVKNTSSVTVMRPWSNWKRVIAARSRILALGATFMSPRLKARR
ncbi:SmtA protein [Salmonella enterica subsp. enterica serovar Daytona]|uniref:SmtA protein n=1 Tax=Salmonella enterica subsp. enterica serovar Daytona TaxID=1962639 RepID=A0A447JK55_SALET|nr:SmtA protein [Salmonella enterica subsp. enterica serovar Daytona]